MFKKAHTKWIYLIKNTFTASLCHHAHRTHISERLRSVRYVPPSDATNTGCTVRDALYAIGYPGPVFNHIGGMEVIQWSNLLLQHLRNIGKYIRLVLRFLISFFHEVASLNKRLHLHFYLPCRVECDHTNLYIFYTFIGCTIDR